MALLVLDRLEEDRLIRERRENGLDRHDEVWDGMYVMSPLADVEHQQLSFKLAWIFQNVLGPGSPAIVTAGVNVSDREQGWLQNYRIPDASVTLPGSHARHCGTHFVGGPDLLVEIVSDDDRSREKLDFYGRIGVRELLIVDRDPWSLELYRLANERLISVGATSPGQATPLASEVLPISFRLVAGEPRPTLEVRHSDGVQAWSI